MRKPPDRARSLIQLLHRDFPRWKLLQDLRHPLGFVPVHDGFLQLLQVNRRRIIAVDFPQLVARQHVKQQVALFQPVHPFLQQLRTRFRRRLTFLQRSLGVEQSPRIFRLVQVIAQPILVFLSQEVLPLLRRIDLRRQFFQVLFERRKLPFQIVQLRLRLRRSTALALEQPRKHVSAVSRAPRQFFLFLFEPHQLRPQQSRLFQQPLVRLARLAELLRVVSRHHELAHEIQKQCVERIEAVRIVHEVPEQHVMLQEQVIVVPSLDKQEAVLQHIVHLVKILAEERPPRFRDRAVLHFPPDAAQRFARLPYHVLSVGLNLSDPRPYHVRLFAVLEQFPARPDPILALHQQARKLVSNFLREVLQQRQVVQDVRLDRLLVLRPRQRLLQDFRQHFPERGVFRDARPGLFPVLPVN